MLLLAPDKAASVWEPVVDLPVFKTETQNMDVMDREICTVFSITTMAQILTLFYLFFSFIFPSLLQFTLPILFLFPLCASFLPNSIHSSVSVKKRADLP